jgi:REP element-mobilizing transposase RayT
MGKGLRIKRRVGLPRMYFHVINRGARQVSIFTQAEDRRAFVSMLGSFTKKHGLQMISWCLMPNHYHLEPDSEGTPLSRMMHDLDSTYSHYFNRKHGGTGCLFEGPYKSFAILGEAGLAYVSRYIHANPRDLQVRPEDYPWSSCRSYLGLEATPSWLNPEPVLQYVRGQDPRPAEEVYFDYLKAVPPKRKRRTDTDDPSDEALFEYVRFLEECCAERILELKAMAGRGDVRGMVSWAAVRLHAIPARVVADYFGVSSPGAVRTAVSRFQRFLDDNPGLEQDLLAKRSYGLRTVTFQRR